MPWLCLPALLLLTVGLPAFAGIQFFPVALLPPIAAWLGARFGWSGVAVLALSALFIVPQFHLLDTPIGGEVGWWVASMVVAILAASRLSLAERLAPPIRSRPELLAGFGIGVLSPLSITPVEVGTAGALTISMGISLWPAFYLALFLLGAKRAPWWLGMAIVATVLVLGWIFAFADAQLAIADEPWLRYGLVSPAAVTAAVACFAVGRAVHRDLYGLRGDELLRRHPRATVTVLLLLWAVPDSLSAVRIPLDEVPWLYLFGSYYLLPLAAFLGGWSLGAAGVRLVINLTIVLIVLRHLLELMLDGSFTLVVNLEWLFIPYVYGALGLAARHDLEVAGSAIRWRRDAALLSAILVSPFLFDFETSAGQVAALFCLAAVLATLIGATRIQRRLARIGIPLHERSWFGVAVALCALAAFATSLPTTFSILAEASAALGSEDAWAEEELWIMGMAVVLVAILAATILELVRCARPLGHDFLRIRDAIRYYRTSTQRKEPAS